MSTDDASFHDFMHFTVGDVPTRARENVQQV